MFTGIVEELGTLTALRMLPGVDAAAGGSGGDAARVAIRGSATTGDARLGDSIAVNGVCLTVAAIDGSVFEADVMRETLRRTTLGATEVGSPVNLERSLAVGGRLGGHFVSGHVDGTGTVLLRESTPRWELLRIGLDDEGLFDQLAPQGSIAVDGVSLTVTEIGGSGDDSVGTPWFGVSLIPTTLESTTLGRRRIGAKVNIETDILAKYVRRLVSGERS